MPNIGLYSPEQIIADILESMRLIVEMHFERQFSKLKAFITIPGDFDDNQKDAVERAAKMAGLYCIRILRKSTAAVMNFGFHE